MSDEKEVSKDNISRNESELLPPEIDDVGAGPHEAQLHPVEAELLPNVENTDIREPEELELNLDEAELEDIAVNPAETESKYSDHESPLEGAVENSRDSIHDSLVEGAVGNVVDCDYGGVHFTPSELSRISTGKIEIFYKFFEDFDQGNWPIRRRRRHPAGNQRGRHRHASEDSKLSLEDPDPLDCLQGAIIAVSRAPSEENETHEKHTCHLIFPAVTKSVPMRSKSAPAGLSMYATDSGTEELQQIKQSKACSEPLPQRKISKDSSVGYSDQNLDDEITYPELVHSQESGLCVPMPDIDPPVVESLQENFNSLTISDTALSAAMQNVGLEQETEQNEATGQGLTTSQSSNPVDGGSPHSQCD